MDLLRFLAEAGIINLDYFNQIDKAAMHLCFSDERMIADIKDEFGVEEETAQAIHQRCYTILKEEVHLLLSRLQRLQKLETENEMLRTSLAELKRILELRRKANAGDTGASSILGMQVSKLGLSTRPRKALLEAGILTVKDILARREEEIYRLRSMGPKGMAELRILLDRHGLTLQ